MTGHRATIDIVQQIRAAFIARGSTLTDWCRENSVDPARAWRALQGKQRGPKAAALRDRIQAAARDL